jgi:hypothetical protein
MNNISKISSETWDSTQDAAKLAITVLLLFVTGPAAFSLKVLSAAVGILNRIVKITGLFKDKRSLQKRIVDEQETAIRGAIAATRGTIRLDTQNKLLQEIAQRLPEIQGAANMDVGALIEKMGGQLVTNPELYVQNRDVQAIIVEFKKNYDDEVLKTTTLLKYINRQDINKAFQDISEIRTEIHEVKNIVSGLTEKVERVSQGAGPSIFTQKNWTLPPDNPKGKILHRETTLKAARAAIQSADPVRLLLTWFAGIGKTALMR